MPAHSCEWCGDPCVKDWCGRCEKGTDLGWSDAQVIDEIHRAHRAVNIAAFERDLSAIVQWHRATVDPGGTIFGPGPYLKVPVVVDGDESVHRVYPGRRLLIRLRRDPRFRKKDSGRERSPSL